MEKIKLSEFGFNILQIESTAACNMACSFCPYPLKDDKITKLDLDNIYKVLDRIDFTEKGFQYVTFSQFNEPLLDKRIFDILKHCKERNIPVHFITNGLLLNKETNAQVLVDAIENIDKTLIKKVKIFDVYEGKNIPSDKKSIALKVTVQSDKRTLNEDDLTNISKKIVKSVEEKTGALLRS